jgi:hypothetical protein
LVFVISFLAHSLPVGMVSSSSSIFAILSYMFVKEFSSLTHSQLLKGLKCEPK